SGALPDPPSDVGGRGLQTLRHRLRLFLQLIPGLLPGPGREHDPQPKPDHGTHDQPCQEPTPVLHGMILLAAVRNFRRGPTPSYCCPPAGIHQGSLRLKDPPVGISAIGMRFPEPCTHTAELTYPAY